MRQTRVFLLRTAEIAPNLQQPRQDFDPLALAHLAASLRQHGMLQPVIVQARPAPSTASPDRSPAPYQLIAGERRWRAAQIAGIMEIPALVIDATPPQVLEMALVENLQRADLSPLEEAQAYDHMMRTLHMTQEEVALRVGRSRAAIANRLRLLNLCPAVQAALNDHRISEGHARALLALEADAQAEAMGAVERQRLSVRATEALVRRQVAATRKPRPTPSAPAAPPTQAAALEDDFRRALGTRVTLSQQGAGGKLVIEFFSAEELDRLYTLIVGAPDE